MLEPQCDHSNKIYAVATYFQFISLIYDFIQTLLDVCGSILLEQLLRIIPVNFHNHHHQYIMNVLNCALKMSLTPTDIKQLVSESRGSPQM